MRCSAQTRSTNSLAHELKTLKLSPVDDDDVLLDLLPPRRQNESAWAARQAIVEYQFIKPLEFQGRGELLLRTGNKSTLSTPASCSPNS